MNSRADGKRDVSRARYKATKKVAKKAIAVATSLAYDRLYHSLGTKEGEKDVFNLEKKGVSPWYIQVIKDMYAGGRTSVRTAGGVTNDFFIGMGLHQGSVLSSFLFTLVMNELTRGIQDELP